jgi:nucleotide-binding universal stress UspA family protein
MQKLTGSWALKVIANSKVPYLVVQEAPHKMEINNVVVPIDFSVENKQKLKWAGFLSQYFHLKVNLFMYEYSDEKFIERTKANMLFAKKYLKEKKIEFTENAASTKGGPLWKQTIEFAESVDADMILIMTTKDIRPTDYVFGADEQQVIANNSKIPVMAVNPKSFGIGGGITF